jgi:DNA-binding MarR family transcriptional regulator
MPTGRTSGRPVADWAEVASLEAHRLTEVVTQLRRALRASVRADIPWESLPMAKVELLQALTEMAPARIGDLAEHLHLANSTVSGLIAQMIDSGLVNRGVDPADRRAAVVSLTKTGHAQLVEWEDAHTRRIGAALAHLSATDRAAIGTALRALGRLTQLLNDPDAIVMDDG